MRLFIGTYTTPRNSIPAVKGKGIVSIEVDPELKRWSLAAEPCPVVDASFQAWAAGRRHLLSVVEVGKRPNRVLAFEVGEDGASLREVGSAETHGRSSCHVTLLPGGQRCAVVSYLDACLDVFVLGENGSLSPESHYEYKGSSTHPRQTEAHAHQICVAPQGDFLFVCDLGSDCIWQHPVDPATGEVGPVCARVEVPAGQGPRHMVFDAHGHRAYVIAELTGEVICFDWEWQQQKLVYRGSVAGLPADYTGEASGAAIVRHPAGAAIIVSQRRHNSLAFFEVAAAGQPAGASLRLVQSIPCGGSEPRDMAVDASGRWLFVANQNSDTVTVFELNRATGMPLSAEPLFAIEVGTPVCVLPE